LFYAVRLGVDPDHGIETDSISERRSKFGVNFSPPLPITEDWTQADQAACDALRAENPQDLVSVLRDGQRCEIPDRELLVGDINFLQKGLIQADGCLVPGTKGCTVNEAGGTGESDAIQKVPGCFLFAGTEVTSEDGETKMLVTAVGDQCSLRYSDLLLHPRAISIDEERGQPWDGTTPAPEAGCCAMM